MNVTIINKCSKFILRLIKKECNADSCISLNEEAGYQMSIVELIEKTREGFSSISNLTIEGVIGFVKSNEGAVITLEVVERRAVPNTMDVLGLYEIKVDNCGNIIGYNRKSLRKRSDTSDN